MSPKPSSSDDFRLAFNSLRIADRDYGAGARIDLTQEELADAIHTKKSVISRLENKASDARVSTLRKVAQALDKELVIELRDRPKQRKRREKVTA